jgi:protein SCO1
MARALGIICIAAIIIATLAVGIVKLLGGGPGASALTPDINMDLLSIPEFELTDQDGEPISRNELLGQLTVVDFIFTNCQSICPPMSHNMKRAQDALAGVDVRFLSISVDPEHDTPDRLKQYAESLGADLTRWTFATGSRSVVSHILTDGLLLSSPVDESQTLLNLADGSTMPNIAHPSRFIFVGTDANILGLYAGTDAAQVDMLIDRAKQAARERSRQR